MGTNYKKSGAGKIKRRRKRQVFASRGGVGVTFQTLWGNRSACPARQACISLAVRDCHRERDSPPEGLSFGFSNIGRSECQSKKVDTQKLSFGCGRIAALNQSSRIPRIVLARDVGPYGFCR